MGGFIKEVKSMTKITNCLNCSSTKLQEKIRFNLKNEGFKEYTCLSCGIVSTNLSKIKPKIKVTLF